MYQIIGVDGTRSEPLSLDALKALAASGGVEAGARVYDPVTGDEVPASQLLVGSNSMEAGQITSTNTYVEADLGARFLGLFLDGLIALPLGIMAGIPVVGLAGAPMLCCYFLSRDAFFAGQSIGKRTAKTRVICLDGSKIGFGQSVLRNITYLPYLALMIPVVGYILFAITGGLAGLADIVCVVATKRRIGDHLAKTMVVVA